MLLSLPRESLAMSLMYRCLLPVLTVVIVTSAPAQPIDAGIRVYQNVLKSTVWVHSNRGTALASGSGSLIDRRRQLILTNYHVVGDVDRATVFFTVYRDGR